MKQIFFLLFLATSVSFGQNYYDVPIGMPLAFRTTDPSNRAISYKIKGSPYQMDEYANGSTTIFNKKGFDAPMRYNAAKDVIEFLDDDDQVKEVLRRPYITASFNGKTYEVLAYKIGGKERLAYFNRLNSGETQLLFKPEKQIVIGSQRFQEVRIANYKDVSRYYIQKNEKPAQMVRLTKAALLLHLSNRNDELIKFISDYDLNLKKEADAIRLIEYYNTLLSPQPKEMKVHS